MTRNYSEKSINNILDFVSSSQDMAFLEEFYSVTLQTLEEAKNEVLSHFPETYKSYSERTVPPVSVFGQRQTSS